MAKLLMMYLYILWINFHTCINWAANTGGSEVFWSFWISAHIRLNQSCFSLIAFWTLSTSAASRWLYFSSPAYNNSNNNGYKIFCHLTCLKSIHDFLGQLKTLTKLIDWRCLQVLIIWAEKSSKFFRRLPMVPVQGFHIRMNWELV